MAYSDNFPATRPVFMADFANGGKIDPRATFTRSDTPPTYAAPSAVHFWSNEKHLSSENLLLQSSDFDTSWSADNLSDRNSGQADPSGGTDGFEIVESTANSWHRVYQSITATGDITAVVYAKQNSGTRYLMMTMGGGGNDLYECATFDLAGGTPNILHGSSSSFTNVSATQTASGNGYYKCVLKATGTCSSLNVSVTNTTATPAGNPYGLQLYTGDGSSSIDVAFASLSTTGATDYNATTTQIHREYAPTLKSVATAGQPRFEYDPASDGQSMGILIEGQAQNLIERSDSIDNAYWVKTNVSVTASAAVGVTGALNACLVTESADSVPTNHNFFSNFVYPTSASSCTVSLYCKSAGVPRVKIFTTVGGNGRYVIYDIVNGTVLAENNGGTGTVESVGNGFYRISMTYTAPTTGGGRVYLTLLDASSNDTYTGNGYNGVITSGWQFEMGSHCSSLISTSGSAVTRAAESLSVGLSDINQNPIGNAVSAVAEFDTNANDAQFRRVMVLKDGTTGLRIDPQVYSGTGYVYVANTSGGTTELTNKSGAGTGFHKVAIGLDGTSANASFDGATASTMSNADTASVQFDTLQIGSYSATQLHLDGHIRNVSLYNVGLSATNVEAITS